MRFTVTENPSPMGSTPGLAFMERPLQVHTCARARARTSALSDLSDEASAASQVLH